MTVFQFFREYVLKIFLICLGAFILLGVAAYILCRSNMDITEAFYAAVSDAFDSKDIIGDDGDISCTALFFNNLRATGISFVMGLVPFLFLPALVLLTNGGIMGVVFAVISSYAPGKELAYLAAGMLPHGIFEIPAICLGISLGLTLCLFECSKILNKGKMAKCDAIEFIGNLCKLFVLVCIPLLIAAAVVESFITPILLNMVI